MVTWDAGGNEFIEVVRTIQACERLGRTLPPPWRYDDHYGFGSSSCIE